MRPIKTFILRLVYDPEAPERLCGEINALPDKKTRSFKNQAELVALLLLGTGGQGVGGETPEKPQSARGPAGEVIP
jgi:hypothetical protein